MVAEVSGVEKPRTSCRGSMASWAMAESGSSYWNSSTRIRASRLEQGPLRVGWGLDAEMGVRAGSGHATPRSPLDQPR